ncbi:unnamed protein product [Miscanthus lutarioriparius]|uniref:Uncharacterized protein n=1 Tax=Miscanthus lutarioriparius TaxID=422564 RepID=A0A811QC24_9POAL|nr:unnamed protein product [Miscanthus lutarioriparius]
MCIRCLRIIFISYSDSSLVVPPACEGYYFLSNSNEALGRSSCTAPGALGSVHEEHGATEYLNVIANHSFNGYGNGDPSCEDLDDPMSVSMLGSGRKCAWNVGEAKRAKKAKKSGDEDSSMAIPNGSRTSCL